jgi:hypothetical protein
MVTRTQLNVTLPVVLTLVFLKLRNSPTVTSRFHRTGTKSVTNLRYINPESALAKDLVLYLG